MRHRSVLIKYLLLGLVSVFVFSDSYAEQVVYSEDFKTGGGDWAADSGVWAIGQACDGCRDTPNDPGDQCAATGLCGNHPAETSSLFYLAFRSIQLPALAEGEELHLRFWHRFSYSTYDSGQVQISVYDAGAKSWGAWENIGSAIWDSSDWSLADIDITAYAGKKIRLGFQHTAICYWPNCGDTSTGWFIDDIEIVAKVPEIMPKIESVSFAGYIPDTCTSLIDVVGRDPLGGELMYTWQLPDGGTLNGAGAHVEFVPPQIRPEPYRVQVAVSSKTTHISSFTKTLYIFTQALYDLDGDGDIDGADLDAFIKTGPVNETTVERFAQEFGMVACVR
jgi:hypothetical protein